MTDKTFAVAGSSRLHGKVKARFAKDLLRVKVLEKGGHTEINLVELPTSMTKADAAEHLLNTGFAKDSDEVREALQAEIERAADKKPKAKAEQVAVAEAEPGDEDKEVLEDGIEDTTEQLDTAIPADMAEVVEAAKEIAAEMTIPEAVPAKPKKGKSKAKREAAEPDANSAFQQWARAADAEEAAAEEEADIEF